MNDQGAPLVTEADIDLVSTAFLDRLTDADFDNLESLGQDGFTTAEYRAVLDNIRRLRDLGKCILFSTHVMQEVAALCDEVVVIAHGTVVASGTPEDIRARTGESSLEDAFVHLIGSGEGLG